MGRPILRRVALLTPPLVQPNTWYPATTVLAGFLKKHGYEAVQRDFSLSVLLKLLSLDGLQEIEEKANIDLAQHRAVIQEVVEFLQNPRSGLAQRLIQSGVLPEGPRFMHLRQLPGGLAREFGRMGVLDQARHRASLFIDDLVDLVQTKIDPQFGFSRYAERISASQKSFDVIRDALGHATMLEAWIARVVDQELKGEFALFGITVPFPGNLVGALLTARVLKRRWPDTPVALGGGYINTELRELAEPRLFDEVDFVSIDSGEEAILAILKHLEDPRVPLERTFVRHQGRVVFSGQHSPPLRQNETGTPTTSGLEPSRYLSMLELLNPAHRLWSEGPWNKLVAAHGCYWKKCAFCDTSLDYIKRYDPNSPQVLVDRMEALIAENGVRGFHFVDEALPPALVRRFSEEILRRNLAVHWWGNIRFDAAFDADLAKLMSRSGCIAVTGGLEVAADRLLKAMQKGVTVAQVEQVSRNFKKCGILVHAYLMYGFPSQTEAEIFESLEMVKRLFQHGCLDSAHWHRFSVTAHSSVGLNPNAYGVSLHENEATFARNDLEFEDVTGVDYSRYSEGLKQAVYNFMHGIGFDRDAREWFPALIKDRDFASRGGRNERAVGKKNKDFRHARPHKGASRSRPKPARSKSR